MEELILHLLLAGHELHVVHQQQVRLPVLGPELVAPAGPDQLDELVDEVVALDVDDLGPGVVAADDVGDGVEQMGLAQARVPVDQQGVVVLGRVLRHGHGGGVGQLVGGAHHEGIKGELRGGKAVALAVGLAAAELREVRIVQDLHFKVRGEDIVEGGFDVFHEQGFDVSLLEIVGAVEQKGIAPDIHRLQLVEPGGDGGLR